MYIVMHCTFLNFISEHISLHNMLNVLDGLYIYVQYQKAKDFIESIIFVSDHEYELSLSTVLLKYNLTIR